MRLDWLLFCLCAALAIWTIQVVCTCRDRGLATRLTLLILAGKALAEVVKQYRAASRRAVTAAGPVASRTMLPCAAWAGGC